MPRRPVEQLARDYVPGSGQVRISPLASGLVNESYRVIRDGRTYSLRVAAENSQDLGVDRHWERRVLEAAVAAGLAPAIECCDPAQGVLVADWIDGRTWTEREIRQPDAIDCMALLLRRVHALPLVAPTRTMSPAAWIAHYAAGLRRRGLALQPRTQKLGGAVEARLALLTAAGSPQPVICHSDLHRQNIMIADRIVLLDWEYAHVSDPFWDLAGWIANNEWTEEPASRLLAAYLGRSWSPDEYSRLQSLVWLYDYVCLLWSELYLNQQPGAASGPVLTRAERLLVRCARAR